MYGWNAVRSKKISCTTFLELSLPVCGFIFSENVKIYTNILGVVIQLLYVLLRITTKWIFKLYKHLQISPSFGILKTSKMKNLTWNSLEFVLPQYLKRFTIKVWFLYPMHVLFAKPHKKSTNAATMPCTMRYIYKPTRCMQY